MILGEKEGVETTSHIYISDIFKVKCKTTHQQKAGNTLRWARKHEAWPAEVKTDESGSGPLTGYFLLHITGVCPRKPGAVVLWRNYAGGVFTCLNHQHFRTYISPPQISTSALHTDGSIPARVYTVAGCIKTVASQKQDS